MIILNSIDIDTDVEAQVRINEISREIDQLLDTLQGALKDDENDQ